MSSRAKCNICRRGLCLAILLTFWALAALAADGKPAGQDKYTGHITGTVTSAKGEPIRGALVEAYSQTGRKVAEKPAAFSFSDQKGGYSLDLPGGMYTVRVKAPKFREREIGKLNLKSGMDGVLPVKMVADVPILFDEMKVVAKRVKKTSEKAQLAERKASINVVDNIGAEMIAKTPESDVAGILTRMPGVVISEGKYMQARGMTKRYNNTTLNGSVVPTTRPNEKLTPLDLFPGNAVDSISVAKTFTPDLPGNFSGGLCQIRTKALPDSLMVKLGYTAKYNTETTGEDYLAYNGGGKDWAGYDDGTRKLPHIIPGTKIAAPGLKDSPGQVGVSNRQREKMGEAFNNTWNTHMRKAHLQSDYEFTAGDRLGKFGLVMSTYYKSNIQNYTDEERTYYRAEADGGQATRLKYDIQRSRVTIQEGGLLNFGCELNADHRITFNNFYNRNTTDEARINETVPGSYSVDDYYKATKLRYIEEEFYSGGVAGDHKFDELLKSQVKWRYNFSLARMNDPDQRTSLYYKNEVNEKYISAAAYTEGLLRQFAEQHEDMDDLAVDWSLEAPSPWSWLAPKFQFGAAYTKRDRDFSMRRFNYSIKGSDVQKYNIDMTQDPETLLQPYNINEHGFYLTETTLPNDKYTAAERLAAGYAMLDFTFFEQLQLFGGVRLERDKTTLDSTSLFDRTKDAHTKLNDNTWEPSVNLKYSPINDMNFRLGFSRTVSRPEFHELSPFFFVDVVGGFGVQGNPDLQVAKIKNYDFRWEWFINPQDILAVSLFYKKIDNAIEPAISNAINGIQTWLNADDAWLKGAEFEARKNLGFAWSGARHWNISGNYVYAESETTLPANPAISFYPTTSKRPLVGQPENMVNLALEYDNPEWGFIARFMYQYTDDRVEQIVGNNLPNILEKEHDRFDLVLIKNFGKHWDVKFTAQNLNNEPYTLTQGGQVHYTYKVGRTFKLGVSWKW